MPHRSLKIPLAELLAKEGILAPEQIGRVLIAQQDQYPSLSVGQVCVELGLLTTPQLTAVLAKHARRIFLGELLVHAGVISQSQLKAALTLQHRHKPRKKLGTILIENGWLDEATLDRALQNQSLPGPRRLPKKRGTFDRLVETKRLTQQQLDEARTAAANFNVPIETVLIEKYHLTTQEIGRALSAFYQCPFLEYDKHRTFDRDLVGKLNLEYLRANAWLPLQQTRDTQTGDTQTGDTQTGDTQTGDTQTGDTIEVLIDDPHAFEKLQDIKRIFPGKQLKTIVGLKEDILKYMDDVAFQLTQNLQEQNLQEQESDKQQETAPEDLPAASDTPAPTETARENSHHQKSIVPQLSLGDESEAVVRLVNQILSDAYHERASDIYIEPGGDEHETQIRLRIDGSCYAYGVLPAAARKPLIAQLKVMARLDIAERRWPQEGKIKISLPHGEIEVRVTTLPTTGIDNEDVVLRILTSREKRSFDQLHLTRRNQRAFADLLSMPSGLLLCVGPTGTGKTTTLHAALATLNTPQRKIWTAEDPVEITQPGLRQLQVQPKIGLTFAAAIRSLLRADPDVIMIGEIRDRETATVCIDAARTGHLVLSTLHTNTATETVARVLEMGIDAGTFADTLLGVMAHRLARTICQACKASYHPPSDEYDALVFGYGEAAFFGLGIAYDDDFVLYRGSGCEQCRQTGYQGRIGLHELLVASDEVKSRIRTRQQAKEIFPIATSQGMTTLVQDGILKVLQGWTDYNQVKAVTAR